MKRTSSRGRRALLFTLSALAMGAPCCGGLDGGSLSQINTLRILAVTADPPYAAPGGTVTLRMTYADALGAAGGEARPVQITWLGGCRNPLADTFEACLPQLQIMKQEPMAPEQSGVPDAASFDMVLPEEEVIFEGAQLAENGTPYTTEYVFFVACAGTIGLAAVTPEERIGLPLECKDEKGNVLSADSFVVGYTQVYVFADGRTNANPPVLGLTLDGAEMADGAEAIPTVARCASAAADPQNAGCAPPPDPASECATHKIEALIEDVAEPDVEASGPSMTPVREAIWVDYFTDGGEFDGAKKLVSDTTTGYRAEHGTTWTPPAEAGLVSLWAVSHDARGGMSVARRFVRVE